MLYSGSVVGVKFHLAGSEEIAHSSYVTVRNPELFRGMEPYPYGVYDAKLGTTGNYKCQTCLNNKKQCIGHAGDLILNYPVINPLASDDILKWLKAMCHACGEIVIDLSRLQKYPAKLRLDKLPTNVKGKSIKCKACNAVHPNVKRDETDNLLFTAETFDDEKKSLGVETLMPHHILDIFSRIKDSSVVSLGKNPISHPRNFILSRLMVPPVNCRPDSRAQTTQSTSDDLTTILHDIIKKNNIMPQVIPATMNDAYIKTAIELSRMFYKFVRDSGEGSVSSIANRLKGKQGRFRKNMLGKRVHNMARSTITGDPTIGIDEVGVPLVFAQTIQIETIVQESNKHILATYVKNGRNYPGATKIRKFRTNVEYDLDPSREIEMEIGDTIMHDVIDGEYVGFNRQPSLCMSNIGMHRCRVTRNPKYKTLRMNVLATPLNANLLFITNVTYCNHSKISKL
jgi:DNA-directed RNA polymerase subunit A'